MGRTTGLELESELQAALRAADCASTACAVWDHKEKVDLIISRVGAYRLRFPVELQVTRQIDAVLKMEAFLVSRNAGRRVVSMYVEVGSRASASAIVRALRAAMEAYGVLQSPPMTQLLAMRVEDDGSWQAFDLPARVTALKDLASPERSAHMRVDGTVAGVDPTGFRIEAGTRTFWSYDGDIADAALRSRIRGHRRGACDALGVAVTFIPGEAGGGPLVRARSVLGASLLSAWPGRRRRLVRTRRRITGSTG